MLETMELYRKFMIMNVWTGNSQSKGISPYFPLAFNTHMRQTSRESFDTEVERLDK